MKNQNQNQNYRLMVTIILIMLCNESYSDQRDCGISYVQEMFGHADILSTQIYAQVKTDDLNGVYMDAHPVAQNT